MGEDRIEGWDGKIPVKFKGSAVCSSISSAKVRERGKKELMEAPLQKLQPTHSTYVGDEDACLEIFLQSRDNVM